MSATLPAHIVGATVGDFLPVLEAYLERLGEYDPYDRDDPVEERVRVRNAVSALSMLDEEVNVVEFVTQLRGSSLDLDLATVVDWMKTELPTPPPEEHQPREHPVPCRSCRRLTWAHSAFCGRCARV